MATLSRLSPSYDAVIVGARCAGAATAMLLARRGLRVLAIDRGRRGSDTLSTHALMRAGILQLRRWGLLDGLTATGVPPVHRAVFHYADAAVEVPVKPRDGVDALYAPRRTVLDPVLVDGAIAAGADVVHGVRLVNLTREQDGRVSGARIEEPGGGAASIETGIVIGADGLRSDVARLAGATAYHVARHASAVVYGYWLGLDVQGYHFYYRDGVSAGAFPTNGDLTCVFAAVPAARFEREIRFDVAAGYQRVIAETDPLLAAQLARGNLSGRLKGAAGDPGFLRQSWGPGWALVGDAAHFKDPITAHGMTDALRDAELLARAVCAGSDEALAGYQAARDDLSRRFHDATEAIASFEWTLDEVQRLHRVLSEEMAREVTFLAALDPGDPGTAADNVADRHVAREGGPNASRSQAFARSQSRWAVRSDTPIAAAVSCSE
jgi:2-polyprenyl-6-methoxyphenol hydroxylase-like FAD-dependent oxidoreductase